MNEHEEAMSEARWAANLLQMLRVNTPGAQVSAIGIEALLRLTAGPMTAAQLEQATGCNNGTLIRQLRRFCVTYDAQGEAVNVPHLKLIDRRRRDGKLQGHLYSISPDGWRFLHQAGLTVDPESA